MKQSDECVQATRLQPPDEGRRSFSKSLGALMFSALTSFGIRPARAFNRRIATPIQDIARSFGIFAGGGDALDWWASTLVQTIGADSPVWAPDLEHASIASSRGLFFEVIALHAFAPIAANVVTDPRCRFIVYDRAFEPFAPQACAAAISVDARDIETVSEAVARYLCSRGLLIGVDFGDLISLDPPLRESEATGIVVRWSNWNTQAVAASNRRLLVAGIEGFGGGSLMIVLASQAERNEFSLTYFDELTTAVSWPADYIGTVSLDAACSAVVLIVFRSRYGRCAGCPKRRIS